MFQTPGEHKSQDHSISSADDGNDRACEIVGLFARRGSRGAGDDEQKHQGPKDTGADD